MPSDRKPGKVERMDSGTLAVLILENGRYLNVFVTTFLSWSRVYCPTASQLYSNSCGSSFVDVGNWPWTKEWMSCCKKTTFLDPIYLELKVFLWSWNLNTVQMCKFPAPTTAQCWEAPGEVAQATYNRYAHTNTSSYLLIFPPLPSPPPPWAPCSLKTVPMGFHYILLDLVPIVGKQTRLSHLISCLILSFFLPFPHIVPHLLSCHVCTGMCLSHICTCMCVSIQDLHETKCFPYSQRKCHCFFRMFYHSFTQRQVSRLLLYVGNL